MEPTKVKTEKCAIYTARYRNLKEIPQGVCQQTDIFYDPSDEAVKWSLQLYANGYPSTDPNSMNNTVGLRMVYHGQEKVVARFAFEVCRNREEFRNQVPTFLKKETTKYCFSFDSQTFDIPNFVSHDILFDPMYKLMPFNTLFLRVKVFYNVDVKLDEVPGPKMEAPVNHVTSNESAILSIGGEEIEMKIEKCAVNTARYRNLQDIPRGFCQQTDEFYDPSDEAIKWSLQLYANGYPSTDPNSMNNAVGLRMIYRGQEKIVARFVFEICRNREEFRDLIPTLLKKETSNFRFSSDSQSLDIPNFLSHEVLFDPKYKLLPFNTLYLRVKVLYHIDDNLDDGVHTQAPIIHVPSNSNTFITLVVGGEEIPHVPVHPLRKSSKLLNETLKDPDITHLNLNNLDSTIVKLILSFILAEASFYEYLEKNPNNPKLLKYAKKLQIDKLIDLLTSLDAPKP